MKKITAILLIGLLVFSQYARQLSYLECQFSNFFRQNVTTCDCNKQAISGKPVNDQHPASRLHTHIHLDEFFSPASQTNTNAFANRLKKGFIPLTSDDECDGKFPKPWQPPNF